jgi:hypothetical protein
MHSKSKLIRWLILSLMVGIMSLGLTQTASAAGSLSRANAIKVANVYQLSFNLYLTGSGYSTRGQARQPVYKTPSPRQWTFVETVSVKKPGWRSWLNCRYVNNVFVSAYLPWFQAFVGTVPKVRGCPDAPRWTYDLRQL